ncbi:MAG TPA: ATP-binding cassette domain-containing protein [Elusimicrobiota bacterium]|nr:ATP-binding cassette domain-containing protein [Elusimicrobiota bacterium]
MPCIAVESLTKIYQAPEKEPGFWNSVRSFFNRKIRHVRAVDGLSFSIEEGELVGFLGANGAGKTTTLKMLSGLLTPTSGAATVLGRVPWRREAELQRRFSLVLGQRSQLWWEIPAQETFRLNQAIYGIPEPEYKRSLGELVELLDLSECLSVPVKKLSLGQRMRAELAAALLHRPAVLFLDEPTLGLDVIMQKKIRAFIREYNAKHKATILLTSHNMDDVSELCSRVVVIERGRLLYDGSLQSLVARHARHKIIRVDFSGPAPADLSAIGTVVSNGGSRAVLEVPREKVSERAAALLRSWPVEDLTIEEVPIDDIVRGIFTGSGRGAAS